jgi:hypothetical protein
MTTTPSPADAPASRTGLCQCGCGAATLLIRHTDRAKGRIKGQPNRFVNGHNATNRKKARYIEILMGHTTPCWIWQLSTSDQGYGLERTLSGKLARAHRISYEALNGPVPPGLQLDHLCRVRNCVNPDHLEPVTPAENVRRGLKTKLTQEIVRYIRLSPEKQAVLGRRFGVGQPQISRIRTNHTWRDSS